MQQYFQVDCLGVIDGSHTLLSGAPLYGTKVGHSIKMGLPVSVEDMVGGRLRLSTKPENFGEDFSTEDAAERRVVEGLDESSRAAYLDRHPPSRASHATKGEFNYDLIGNTASFLVVSNRAAKILSDQISGSIAQMIPIDLVDEDGSLVSTNYTLLNPTVVFDCLCLKQSRVLLAPNSNKIIKIKAPVIQANFFPRCAPAVFRMKHFESHYLFSADFVRALAEAGCTNFDYNIISSCGCPDHATRAVT